MRIVFLLAIVLPTLLHAQVQEPKLLDRLLKPDTTLAFQPQNTTFQNDKSFSGTGKAYVKDFLFEEKVQTKQFTSKDYLGSKDFWSGDFKFSKYRYSTSDPLQSRYVIPNASKSYDTATSSEIKNARESGRTAPGGKYADNGPFKGRFEDQTNLATDPKAEAKENVQEQRARKATLSIDQVRDLLNKNK